MSMLRRCLAAATLCVGPAGLSAQATGNGAGLALGWYPREPVQGSLLVLTVRLPAGDSTALVRGGLAGEPLHFERFAEEFRALGAVPLGARDTPTVQVIVDRPGGTSDTLSAALRVARRHVPRERLHVAPGFARPPDSLAERIRLEQELVQGVRQRAHETPRMWRAPFLRPSPGAVSSVFGVARVFNGVLRSRHWGVDFAAQRGAPVRAANRGVIALVADLYFSGTTVLIDHGAGLVTGYFHLSKVLVVPGDTVRTGQLLGRAGASGRVTRPHLHWFAAYGSVTVDPLDLLRPGLMSRLGPAPPPPN
jgi:murein DD-endopeptidase MepM/ murein hydrolase activator NlpD